VVDNGRFAVFNSRYSAALFGVVATTLLRTLTSPPSRTPSMVDSCPNLTGRRRCDRRLVPAIHGAFRQRPGATVQAYLDRLHGNWTRAEQALH
jgi:hypothetical protein